MGLSRTVRLEVDPQVRPESLPLGPQEYFVLSRIEGRPTVGEVLGASGLGADLTTTILERLLELGALRTVESPVESPTPVVSGPAASSPRRKSTQELRAQAADRRRRMLAQQLGASRSSEASGPRPVASAVSAPVAVSGEASSPPAGSEGPPDAPPDEGPVVVPVPPDDPRLDDALGLTCDQQRHLLALEDRLDSLTPFELLGLRPTHDLKAIRAAFRESSRALHPDAHHGRALGRYRELLSTLFVRAKQAHAALQQPEVREPLVAAMEAAREAEAQEQRRRQQQREAAREAAEQLRRRREEEQAAERRAARAAQQAERQRERLTEAVRAKVAEHIQAAVDAENMENYARAANNYRLALQLDPQDQALRERWQQVRSIARRRRAKDAFAQACTLVEVGHGASATPLYLEAAEADPTIEHLAHAADAVREQDPAQARDLAMDALRLLGEDERSDAPMRASVVADLRLMIGRAFLAAGQTQTAREQARLVQKLRPGDPAARALLNSAKVT